MIQTFIGNSTSVGRLTTAVSNGTNVHAYLITGASQVGKRTLALNTARLALCHSRTGTTPCETCPACIALRHGRHPDLHIVEKRDDKRTILTEQAQEMVRTSHIRPYLGVTKVFIVRDATLLEAEAANRLLKTVEEPPDGTIVLLTAVDGDQVLATIRSRCQEIHLRPVVATTIAEALATRGTSLVEADLLSRLAGGRPGWALAALADPTVLATRAEHLSLLDTILRTPQIGRLPLADRLEDPRQTTRTRENLARAFETWITWWRDALVMRAECPELLVGVDQIDAVRRVASRLTTTDIINAIHRTWTAWGHLDANVNARLTIEGLLLALPAVA